MRETIRFGRGCQRYSSDMWLSSHPGDLKQAWWALCLEYIATVLLIYDRASNACLHSMKTTKFLLWWIFDSFFFFSLSLYSAFDTDHSYKQLLRPKGTDLLWNIFHVPMNKLITRLRLARNFCLGWDHQIVKVVLALFCIAVKAWLAVLFNHFYVDFFFSIIPGHWWYTWSPA